MRCQLSSSFRRSSPFSSGSNTATGALPALQLVPTLVSFFNALQYGYRCVSHSDARLPLAIRLQVRCTLSTSFRRASPISTAWNTSTGALPALYLVPTLVSFFIGLQYDYRCVARSDTRLPFQPLAIRLQVRCQLSSSFRRSSPFSTGCNTATGALPALTRVSHFNRLQYVYRCVASSLPCSDARLLFHRVAIRLQVRCQLSSSFRRSSPFSSGSNTAIGALPALQLVPMLVSFFNALQYGYRCVAHSDMRLPFQPFAIRLQVRCQLSSSFRRSSPFSSGCNKATGALPALQLVPTLVSFFNGLQYGYRCVARSDTRLPFQPPAIRLQVRCQLSTSFRRSSPFSSGINTATGALPALQLVPTLVSFFNGLQYGYRCVARSDMRLPFQPLAIRLPVRCQLSTSFRRSSPFSSVCNRATGALPALQLVPTLVSFFNGFQYGYRCVAHSLPRSDARLPFQPLAIRLQVCCQLSTSFGRSSPFSSGCNTATGALPALQLVPTLVSFFNGLQYGYRFVAHSDTRLPFQPLAVRLQVRCQLSTSFRRSSRISTAFNTAAGPLRALHLVVMRVSYFNCFQQGYRCVARSLPGSDACLPF